MMKIEARVIPLGVSASRRRSGLALPPLLENIRDLALSGLRQGMQSLFDDMDDTLFDLADRAENNQEQGLYFEAMRDLRLKRQGIERTFLDRCAGGFEGLMGGTLHLPATGNAEPEVQLAEDAMIVKTLGHVRGELEHLNTRLGVVLDKKIANDANPLAPHAICAFFAEAGSETDLPIRIQLILLELFERHCLGRLDALCSEANRLLEIPVGETQIAMPGKVILPDGESRVDQLRVGSWLEIRLEGDQKLRCKLVALIKHTATYVFVNRSGAKVLEKNRTELMEGFASGVIRLLDDAQIFDRALESVINLRRGTVGQP